MFTIETFPATVQQTTESERKALDICESMAYVYGFARVVDYDGNTIKELFSRPLENMSCSFWISLSESP